jgi:ornithine cyclodeaminase/alanine dehydrogenase-like protein (mu-crystallin family)
LILTRSDVGRIIATDDGRVLDTLIDRLRDGYAQTARGLLLEHPRIYLRYPEPGMRRPPGLFSMSALLPEAGIMGTRLIGVKEQAGDAILVLFDYTTQRLLAIMDDYVLHNYRTGTPGALAARYLARADSRVVACIGSGNLARGGVTMLRRVLPAVRAVRIYSPTASHRQHCAAELRAALGLDVTAADSAEEAAAEADVLVTATNADRPVVADAAIRPGTHISLMARNEIEMATFRRSKIVVPSAATLAAWDPPWHEPLPSEWIHGELPALVTGQAEGRRSAQETTVFVGSSAAAMWDVVAASVFYEAGREMGYGTEIDVAS